MPSFSLERFVGAAAGDDAAFDGRETYTVGRKPSCNLVLSDSRVSGLHATFSKQEAGRIAVVDSSSNGTYLNGVLLPKGESRVLEHGDVTSLVVSLKIPFLDNNYRCSSIRLDAKFGLRLMRRSVNAHWRPGGSPRNLWHARWSLS